MLKHYKQTLETQVSIVANLGPVVQSIISLMISFRGQLIKCFTTL